MHHWLILHEVKLEDSMSPWPLSSILNTSITGDLSRFRIRQVPSVFTTDFSPGRRQKVSLIFMLQQNKTGLTFKKGSGKVDANVAIPASSTFSSDFAGYTVSLQLFESQKYSGFITKPDNDLGNAQKKRLRPELEQFTLVFVPLLVVEKLGACFQFHPVDWVFFTDWFAIPDLSNREVSMTMGHDKKN
jgi:hypothetical protein